MYKLAFMIFSCSLVLTRTCFNWFQVVLEADGYQPYLISPEKGLRSLIKGVLELAKEPSRLCVDEVIVVLCNCFVRKQIHVSLHILLPFVLLSLLAAIIYFQ